MGNNMFNPGSERYRRGVIVVSFYTCTLIGAQMLVQDYGRRDHVFSGTQEYIRNRLDKYYEIKEEEIAPLTTSPDPLKTTRTKKKPSSADSTPTETN